jgi:hypothetical protein
MKSLFRKIVLIASVISFAAIRTYAQEKEPEMPAGVKNLMKFLGYWEANATLTLEGKTYKVLYWFNCKQTADGNGIYADEGFSNPELGTMKGANLVGFDPFDAKIKWFSIDNMGTTHEHVGDWLTPDHLFVEHFGTRDGKKYVEKNDFIFNGKDELVSKLVGTLDGVETERGEGVFKKKSTPAKK